MNDGPVWPAATGEMAERIRAHNWAATPLGPVENWRVSLKTAVDMVLAMPGPATILWGPTHIQLYNDAYIAIARDRHPTLLGRPVAEGWADAYDEVIAPLIEAAQAGHATVLADFPVALREPDGGRTERFFDTSWSPLFDESGAAGGSLQILTEVTARHRAEAALRESERRYRALINATSDVVYRMSPDWTEMRQLDGRGFIANTEAPSVKWLEDYILPEDQPRVLERIEEAIRAKRPFELEHRVRRIDGSTGWTFSRAIPILNDEGEIVEWFGMATDVTKRHETQRALRESEQRQMFLLKLSDALRPLGDPEAIQDAACATLREHLGVDWSHCSELDFERQIIFNARDFSQGDDLKSHVGEHDMRLFPVQSGAWAAGRSIAVDDIAADAVLSEVEREAMLAQGIGAALTTPLVKNGTAVAVMSALHGTPRHWRPEDVATLQETVDRTWEAVERARAEAALRESEEKYRTLFETMGQGFCELRLVRDADGRAFDQLYLEFNPAYERLIGIPVAQAKGRTASEVMPNLEPWWTETFDRIAANGEPERIEHQVASLGRWFEVYVYPRGGDRLIVLYEDITDQKRAEKALGESEERQALLLKLSDALRLLANPVEVQRTATELVAEHFRVESAVYFDVGVDGDQAALTQGRKSTRIAFPPVIRFSDFASFAAGDFRDGHTISYEDVETDPRFEDTLPAFRALSIRSGAGVPLVKGGRLVAVLAANHVEPREWTPAELRLLEDVADRTWAAVERARAEAALRESEERFRLIVENATDYAIFVTDPDGIITDWLPGAEAVFGWTAGEAIGRDAGITFTPEDQAQGVPDKEIETAANKGLAPDVRWHQRKDGNRVFIEGTVTPLRAGNEHILGYLKIGQDVTERRNAQEALEASERRMRSLATGIPQLVFRSRGDGGRTWGSPQWIEYTGLSFEESLGYGWLDKVHPDDRPTTLEAWTSAEERGEYYVEHRIFEAASGAWRWHQTRATPLRDEEGTILEWLGTSTNVEEMRRLQRHQQTLLAELQHRVRNTLGVVRSIARRTAETSDTVEEMAAHLAGRLDAFSRVQSMGTRDVDGAVDLATLIEDELLAHAAREGEHLKIDGPAMSLKAKSAEMMSLAIHELATNAVKYGALSDGGRLSVTWRREARDGGEWLVLDWRESGADAEIRDPGRRGFGLELLTRTLPYDLKAETRVDFRPGGLRFALAMPLGGGVEAR